MKISFLDSFEQIAKSDWQRLNKTSCPLLKYDFFQTLESSHSVAHDRGWQPHHMIIESSAHDKESVIGIMPLYLKQHSWGEYVFDWAWAQAYEEHNMSYYPKLVATVPFTPLPTNKLMSETVNLSIIFAALTTHCQQEDISSWHILFVPELKNSIPTNGTKQDNTCYSLPDNIFQRHTVQFHWFNRGYKTFDDFLAKFTSRKRKNTRKERLSIDKQGIEIRTLQGEAITSEDLDFFYLTYQLTYMKNGHQPHLTFEFFKGIFDKLKSSILLIVASYEDEDVACSLFFYDEKQLYGRYWGCKTEFKNLHFELCYYQGIEFCIKHNLQCFNPGTQGEHKIKRGFEPVLTHSYHWVKEPAFRPAIKDFCYRESEHMHIYMQQCADLLPFKITE